MSFRSSRARRLWSNVPLPEAHLLGIATGSLLHRLRPWTLPGPPGVRRFGGWTLTAFGTLILLRSFTAAREVHLASPDRLVTSGPYAVSRNPMYAGWVLIHLGAGLMAGSCWVLVTLPASAAWVHREVLREERALDERFGAKFVRYRERVPRYIPAGRRKPT